MDDRLNDGHRAGSVTRRTVLRGALVAAVSGAFGADAAGCSGGTRANTDDPHAEPTHAQSGSKPSSAPSASRGQISGLSRPPASSPPPPELASRVPVTASMLPIHSLPQYVARTPGARAFPSGAVMLTIDDGPHPVWTPKILQLLAKYDVTATFCVIGDNARRYPMLVRAAAGEGHLLANHTFAHPLALTTLPASAMCAQVVDAQDAIVTASGATPYQFRSPGGHWSPQLLRLLAGEQLTPIDWDVDPRDWARPGIARVISRMLAARPGDVLLCHDGGGDRSQTYRALKIVLPRLKARGLQFVTLSSVR